MLKIFRKIRQNLLSEIRTGKPAWPVGRYLKYALGEIALVMKTIETCNYRMQASGVGKHE